MSDSDDPRPVVITPRPNGAYRVDGLEELRGTGGERLETRAKLALCRCGHSETKPFCDGTHKRVGFDSSGPNEQEGESVTAGGSEPCVITVSENGPYEVRGRIRVEGVAAGDWAADGPVWLCRCGASGNKPFCDGSHRAVGFTDPGS